MICGFHSPMFLSYFDSIIMDNWELTIQMGNASIHSFNKYFKMMTGISNLPTCNKASLKEADYKRIWKTDSTSFFICVFLVLYAHIYKEQKRKRDELRMFLCVPKPFMSLSFLLFFNEVAYFKSKLYFFESSELVNFWCFVTS